MVSEFYLESLTHERQGLGRQNLSAGRCYL